jgi:multiple sugar transport system substrate-binding protein
MPYTTAPIPVADDHTDLYGSGTAGGNTLGIAKSSKNPDLAWALLKYLTTDTKALVGLNNALGNTPSTRGSLDSPLNKLPQQSATFLAIAKNPHSYALPPTVIGAARVTNITNYWQQWQAGSGGDLAAGLAKVDSDTNNAIKLSEGQ